MTEQPVPAKQLAIVQNAPPMELSVDQMKNQVQKIQGVMKAVMKKDTHYGTIPGTNKPTLYKAGAEKLMLTFRLRPEYDVLESSIFRESYVNYRIRAKLYHIPTGDFIAEGLGSCNSNEKKYTSRDCQELDNTLMKMACKRALVAAVLSGTAASDIFTQDMEENINQNHSAGPVTKTVNPPTSDSGHPSSAPRSNGDGDGDRPNPASEKQWKYVEKLARNIPEDEADNALKMLDISGWDELTRDEAHQLIDSWKDR